VAASAFAAAPQSISLVPIAHADEARDHAAAVFDQGVAMYKRADYEAAAYKFLEADDLSPSELAITNAIAAARRGGNHLLVARASERAIARGEAVAPAREALAEAATMLARVELRCEPSPCTLSVDGEAASSSSKYLLPGTHEIAASGSSKTRVERLSCVAGATYRVALRLDVEPEIAASPTEKPPQSTPAKSADPSPPPAHSQGASRAWFVGGVGVTVILVGVTTWSGLDALSAKRALPAEPEQSQNDSVLGRAHRTDALLAGALLAGVGTATLGFWFTDWSGGKAVAAIAPSPDGASFALRGHF
jgi:hypothetical protein